MAEVLFSLLTCSAGLQSAVGIESLRCFSLICSQSKDALSLELLAEFPALLVSLSNENQVLYSLAYCLSSENCHELQLPSLVMILSFSLCTQGVRTAAMECLEGLHTLCAKADVSGKKNGITQSEVSACLFWQNFQHKFMRSNL